jgi:hypothetical protein
MAKDPGRRRRRSCNVMSASRRQLQRSCPIPPAQTRDESNQGVYACGLSPSIDALAGAGGNGSTVGFQHRGGSCGGNGHASDHGDGTGVGIANSEVRHCAPFQFSVLYTFSPIEAGSSPSSQNECFPHPLPSPVLYDPSTLFSTMSYQNAISVRIPLHRRPGWRFDVDLIAQTVTLLHAGGDSYSQGGVGGNSSGMAAIPASSRAASSPGKTRRTSAHPAPAARRLRQYHRRCSPRWPAGPGRLRQLVRRRWLRRPAGRLRQFDRQPGPVRHSGRIGLQQLPYRLWCPHGHRRGLRRRHEDRERLVRQQRPVHSRRVQPGCVRPHVATHLPAHAKGGASTGLQLGSGGTSNTYDYSTGFGMGASTGTNKPSTGDKIKGAPRSALASPPDADTPADTIWMVIGESASNHARVKRAASARWATLTLARTTAPATT